MFIIYSSIGDTTPWNLKIPKYDMGYEKSGWMADHIAPTKSLKGVLGESLCTFWCAVMWCLYDLSRNIPLLSNKQRFLCKTSPQTNLKRDHISMTWQLGTCHELRGMFLSTWIYSPWTNCLHLKIDGWETILSFWVSADFQLLFIYGLVSGRVYAGKKTAAKHHTDLPRWTERSFFSTLQEVELIGFFLSCGLYTKRGAIH